MRAPTRANGVKAIHVTTQLIHESVSKGPKGSNVETSQAPESDPSNEARQRGQAELPFLLRSPLRGKNSIEMTASATAALKRTLRRVLFLFFFFFFFPGMPNLEEQREAPRDVPAKAWGELKLTQFLGSDPEALLAFADCFFLSCRKSPLDQRVLRYKRSAQTTRKTLEGLLTTTVKSDPPFS